MNARRAAGYHTFRVHAPPEARALVAPVYGRCFDTAELQAAKALLDRLG